MPLTGASNESRFLFTLGTRTDIRVLSLHITESLSTNFTVDLTLACDQEVAFDDVIGQKACLTVLGHQTDRYWHGVIRDFTFTGTNERFLIFRATLVPILWLLTQEQDCRIFQGENTQQIVETILKEAGLTSKEYAFNNQNPGTTREYCVQYRESDFNFISRLLEEDGILFFFNHDQKDTTVVFGDGPSAYKPIDGQPKVALSPSPGMVSEAEFVRTINFSRHVHSGKITVRDYNFEKPALDLTSEGKDKVFGNLEVYDYPGRYSDQDAGKKIANLRLQQTITYKDQCMGDSVCPRFAPGRTFTLRTSEKRPEFTKEYMLVSVSHVGEQPQALEELANPHATNSYHNTFTCIPSSVTFRPQGAASKPIISSVQTAMVVGPAGEEIFTDQYGRIKVQFHWDRKGKKDDKSSCWIRVSQVFTGASWGAMAVPRIGQEMIVSFLEGDPDRPIITGRVYHGNNPVPYGLPDEKTKTTLKSNSSLGGGGFNELRFEDKKGQEEIFLHAQKDWNTKVLNDRNTLVKANQTTTVEGTRTTTVVKKETQTFKDSREVTIDKTDLLKITQTRDVEVTGKLTEKFHAGREDTVEQGDKTTVMSSNKETTVHGEYNIVADTQFQVTQGGDKLLIKDKISGESTGDIEFSNGKVDIKADTGGALKMTANSEITLSCGQASISLKADGSIEIKGASKVALSAGASKVILDATGVTSDAGSGMNVISGVPVKIN
jgi:type VI secretion system secreted protein VgrG